MVLKDYRVNRDGLRAIFFLAFILVGMSGKAQSKTTESLQEKNKDALVLFFYQNTLRMINQKEDKEFDDLIRNIEKMKFLVVNKDKGFGAQDYRQLVDSYQKESFEAVMTSRHEGRNFDIFLKESTGKSKGMLVLVNDSTTLFVLDIVGWISPDKVTKLYSTLDESTDVSKKIQSFMDKDQKKD